MKNKLCAYVLFRASIAMALCPFFSFCSSSETEAGAGPDDAKIAAFNEMVRGMAAFSQEEAFQDGRERDCTGANDAVNEEAACEQPYLRGELAVLSEALRVDDEPYRTVANPTGTRTADYGCTTRRRRRAIGYDELFLLDPDVDVIYPGAVLDGNTIPTGAYEPIIAPRKLLKISASIRGADGTISREIENPSRSSVSEAINEILRARNLGNIQPPAHNTLTIGNVYSNSEFGVSAGINIEAQLSSSFQAGLGFEFSSDSSETRQQFLARFSQRYYSITIDLPANPADLFSSLPDIPPGTSPVYVSSVRYGRLVLFNMRSYQSELSIGAALQSSISITGRASLMTDTGAAYYNSLQNSTVNATIIGGSGTHCNGIADSDDVGTSGIINCIAEGGQVYSDAVPLSYTLRYLKNNRIANVVLHSEYTAHSCKEARSKLNPVVKNKTIQLKGIGTSSNDGEAFSMGYMEMAGYVAIRATDKSPQSVAGPCSGFENQNASGYRTVWEQMGSSIAMGSYYDLKRENRKATIPLEILPIQQNIEVCVNLSDQERFADAINYNSRANYSQVLSINSQHLGEPAGATSPLPVHPIPLRFTTQHGNVWFELYLYKLTE